MTAVPPARAKSIDRRRNDILARIESWLEPLMLVLGFVWLILLVAELTGGATPLLSTAGTAIWVIFIIDFALRFSLAPSKPAYLRRNWLVAVSLAIPALRSLRIVRAVLVLRAARATRGLRLLRVLTSINRGMSTLSKSMKRRGIGYVLALTLVVLFAGAAGMYAFERDVTQDLSSYGSAVWWTAMILVTMGTGEWPRTPEGRILSLFLAVYGFSIFGYITATITTFFVDSDAADPGAAAAGSRDIERLRHEIRQMRRDIRSREDAEEPPARGTGSGPAAADGKKPPP